jgi:hypothetical protein
VAAVDISSKNLRIVVDVGKPRIVPVPGGRDVERGVNAGGGSNKPVDAGTVDERTDDRSG